jgi:hypothetical protein
MMIEPRYSEYLVFEGISVDDDDKPHYNDVTIEVTSASARPSGRRAAPRSGWPGADRR